jgi:hypothetical protein
MAGFAPLQERRNAMPSFLAATPIPQRRYDLPVSVDEDRNLLLRSLP